MQNVNLGTFSSAGLDFGLLAAALILVFGIWRGRRDLGQRAALGVLTTLAGATVLSLVGFLLGFRGSGALGSPLIMLTVFSVVSLIVSFLPLYIAANWVEVILRETRSEH